VIRSLLIAVLLPSLAGAQAGGMLSLGCVEALVAIGETRLAGVFSFVSEKDSAPAFADLIVHDAKLLKKFVAKAEKDLKETQGVSTWDKEAITTAVTILNSPIGETLEKPSKKMMDRLHVLSGAPALTLEQLSQKRSKK
jgi:hypothetical protein